MNNDTKENQWKEEFLEIAREKWINLRCTNVKDLSDEQLIRSYDPLEAYFIACRKRQEEIDDLSRQLDEALSAVRSFEKTHTDRDLFQAKIWFKSVLGNDDFFMFINEAPFGGFEWNVLDFEPEDKENYKPLFVHNFTIEDLDDLIANKDGLEKENARLREEIEIFQQREWEKLANMDKQIEKLESLLKRSIHFAELAIYDEVREALDYKHEVINILRFKRCGIKNCKGCPDCEGIK